jgi:hypothetical protein
MEEEMCLGNIVRREIKYFQALQREKEIFLKLLDAML